MRPGKTKFGRGNIGKIELESDSDDDDNALFAFDFVRTMIP
jgi:hypothetical protein